MIDLSIVIPAYNEEDNLKRQVLDEVNDYLSSQNYTWEVLVVDDGSNDQTAKLTEGFVKKHAGFKLLKEPHRGKGGTVIAGVIKAEGKVILFSDMDQATPISQVEKILPKFKEGFDIVIGSRGGGAREGAPLVRKVMAFGFIFLRRLILRLPFKDTQCGFKAFERQAALEIFDKMKIFSEKAKARGASVSAGFDLEILYLARKMGLRVAEVEVAWHHQEGTRVSAVKDSWEGLRDLLKVRFNALMGRYQ